MKNKSDTKKYLASLPWELYEEMVKYQKQYNADHRNVGVVTINNMLVKAMRQFLIEN